MKEEKEKVDWIVDFWSNGQKRFEIPYVNGKRHGIETHWHQNGQKCIERTWENGDQHVIETLWYANGTLRFVSKWNQGQLVVEFQFRKSDVPKEKVAEVDILTKEFTIL
jgi:antitoxin component YwqK of YwqJK toxin-antitoxin module